MRIQDVLADRLVEPLFQPVVDLDRDEVVAYEALARGPEGPLHAPDALFAAARSEGLLPELDWLCREQAVHAARRAGLRYPLSLFVNAEPETLLADEDDARRWAEFGDIRCYCEVTERALTEQPGALLRSLDQVRAQDWGIALDDVGAVPASLTLAPLLKPDVMKLDMRLLHREGRTPAEDATVLHAVLAQAQASGAVVVAEGIETPEHLERARAWGVTCGQGYLLGRPAPLPTTLSSPSSGIALLGRPIDRQNAPGPFTAAAGNGLTRRVGIGAVWEVVHQLLTQAAQLAPPPAVLGCLDRRLPADLEEQAVDLMAAVPFSGFVGTEQAALVVHPLGKDDPAAGDLALLVVNAFFAAAVVARPTLGDGADELDMVLTFDRDVVLSTANDLASRL